jgi:putative phosphoribosyl transferase
MDTGARVGADRSSHDASGSSLNATRFRDRTDAGRRLAAMLEDCRAESPVVLGLPRGGVPVAYEVARSLQAPLDVLVVRKVEVPWHPELGAGAVSEGGYLHLSADVLAAAGLDPPDLAAAIDEKRKEVEARVRRFRHGAARVQLRNRTVVLVDDGIATGGTVHAALRTIKAMGPRKIVLAVPVASPKVLEALAPEVDRIVCPMVPADLYAIGLWYQDFAQVTDDEVVRLLKHSRSESVRRSDTTPT